MDIQVDILARELYLEFSNWNLTYMKDIWTLRPGFYSEFRYESREHSGLAWGAILRKVLVLTLFPRLPCSFFQEHVPRMDFFPKRCSRKGTLQNYQVHRSSQWFVFQYFQVHRSSEWLVFQYFQVHRSSEWVVFQYFQVHRSWNCSFFSISRFTGHQHGSFSIFLKINPPEEVSETDFLKIII